MSNPTTEADQATNAATEAQSAAGDGLGESPVRKFHIWRVRREDSEGYSSFCDYQSNYGPVTSEHVITSPSVRDWLRGHTLTCIYPPSSPENAIHFPNKHI